MFVKQVTSTSANLFFKATNTMTTSFLIGDLSVRPSLNAPQRLLKSCLRRGKRRCTLMIEEKIMHIKGVCVRVCVFVIGSSYVFALSRVTAGEIKIASLVRASAFQLPIRAQH